jgi:hypothetical protein
MDTEKTLVIFRKFNNDDVIAIFPELPGDYSRYTCLSYIHVGQHGSCSPNLVIRDTKPATPAEYEDLRQELTRVGYDLVIKKRYTYKMLLHCSAELDRMNQAD